MRIYARDEQHNFQHKPQVQTRHPKIHTCPDKAYLNLVSHVPQHHTLHEQVPVGGSFIPALFWWEIGTSEVR